MNTICRLADELRVQEAQTEVSISPNQVVLDVSGPCYESLSILSTPGIYVNDGSGNDGDADMTYHIARFYVSRPHVAVAWAIPAHWNPANSNALRVIRDAGASSRCTVIATKVDLSLPCPRSAALWALDEDHWPDSVAGPLVIGRPAHCNIDEQDAFEHRFFSDPAFDQFRLRCGALRMARILQWRLYDRFRPRLVLVIVSVFVIVRLRS